jgi:hypothetical protein
VTAQTQPETQLPPPPAEPRDDGGDGGGSSPAPSPSEEDGDVGSTPAAGGDDDSGGGGGDRSDSAAGSDEPSIGSEPNPEEVDGGAAAEERIAGTGDVLGVETEVAQSADVTSDGPLQQALRDVGPTGGDDLPVPVLVLGGLAVLLIAVGAGGIVLRRLQSR